MARNSLATMLCAVSLLMLIVVLYKNAAKPFSHLGLAEYV